MKTIDKKPRTIISQPVDYTYDDEQRDAGDYINSDHSEYNRGNNRFGWYEPEE